MDASDDRAGAEGNRVLTSRKRVAGLNEVWEWWLTFAVVSPNGSA